MTEKQFNEIHEWQKATFPNATPFSKLAHLIKEIVELKDSIVGGNPQEAKKEYADCFFLLFGSAAAYGMSFQDICNAVEEKFQINKSRSWGKPDADGVVEHIK